VPLSSRTVTREGGLRGTLASSDPGRAAIGAGPQHHLALEGCSSCCRPDFCDTCGEGEASLRHASESHGHAIWRARSQGRDGGRIVAVGCAAGRLVGQPCPSQGYGRFTVQPGAPGGPQGQVAAAQPWGLPPGQRGPDCASARDGTPSGRAAGQRHVECWCGLGWQWCRACRAPTHGCRWQRPDFTAPGVLPLDLGRAAFSPPGWTTRNASGHPALAVTTALCSGLAAASAGFTAANGTAAAIGGFATTQGDVASATRSGHPGCRGCGLTPWATRAWRLQGATLRPSSHCSAVVAGLAPHAFSAAEAWPRWTPWRATARGLATSHGAASAGAVAACGSAAAPQAR